MLPDSVLLNFVPSDFFMSGHVFGECLAAAFATYKFRAGGDITLLIGAAHLQFAVFV